MLDLAEQTGVVNRKGAWYSYNGENIAQGRDNAVKYLEDKPEVAAEVEKQVREKIAVNPAVGASILPESEEAGFEEE